eukprot:jgi/Botrbrau1/8347/Bobra.0046s0009.1
MEVVLISYRGKVFEYSFDNATTARQLAERVVKDTGVAFETIKLLFKDAGGKSTSLQPFREPDALLRSTGMQAGAKVLLMASSASIITALREAKDDPTVAGFNHELKTAQRRRLRGGAAVTLPKGPYTFQDFRALQGPAFAYPPPSEALRLLHRLAADPGVVAIMEKHRWTVGLLSEMPPEGKVGVSPVCILGLNVNHGQEIQLRLRTDDLKGFRHYTRIRMTLCHELAHMVWGEHDNNFKALNSQLLKEVEALDWTRGAYAQDAGSPGSGSTGFETWVDPDDVMAVTAQTSGKTLRALSGPSHIAPPPADPRAAARTAALARLGGQLPASSRDSEITPSHILPRAAMDDDGLDDRESSWAISGLGHDDVATEAKEEELMKLGCLD